MVPPSGTNKLPVVPVFCNDSLRHPCYFPFKYRYYDGTAFNYYRMRMTTGGVVPIRSLPDEVRD